MTAHLFTLGDLCDSSGSLFLKLIVVVNRFDSVRALKGLPLIQSSAVHLLLMSTFLQRDDSRLYDWKIKSTS